MIQLYLQKVILFYLIFVSTGSTTVVIELFRNIFKFQMKTQCLIRKFQVRGLRS